VTTVRLNNEIDNKLRKLIETENTSKSEIIKKAISEYFEGHYQEKSPFELGEDLFGKFGADEDLSTTYKKKLKGMLNEKHSH
jgi:predicted transcriptional regulator